MNKLLKDAIADAKAVRETALANAKVALEEAFAPKLQSMLSHKIKEEMMGEGEEVDPEVTTDEAMKRKKRMEMAGLASEGSYNEDEDDMPEDGELEPEDDELEPEDDELEPEDDEFEPEDDDMGDMGDMGEDDNLITIGGQQYEIKPVETDTDVADEELEELLRELDEDNTDLGNEDNTDLGNEDNTYLNGDNNEGTYDEEINLEEIIAALREEDNLDNLDDLENPENPENPKSNSVREEELEEAYGVIKYLRSKMNEVNLLNAKLLYVNKLFRKGELTETQKVKIIETFDRAKNVREAKLIYATLSESVNSKAKKPAPKPKTKMNEGLASAPSKATKIIAESNNVYSRFKTLVEYNNK